jgi:hypothetical protein
MTACNCNNVDENKPVLSKTSEMLIGKVTYTVTTHYNENGRETAEQKLFRYISDRISADMKTPANPVK